MTIKNIHKFIYEKEIKSVEVFYPYIDKFKIIVFVPEANLEILAKGMSKAGAGFIGKYSFCSFRTEGTGTFIPGKNTKPFAGEKNKLSFVKEIKLEMEFDRCDLNKVTDAVLKFHPYEETAYEIYSFIKRSKNAEGLLINLKSTLGAKDIFKRLNIKLDVKNIKEGYKLKNLLVLNSDFGIEKLNTGYMNNIDCVITSYNKNYKFFKI